MSTPNLFQARDSDAYILHRATELPPQFRAADKTFHLGLYLPRTENDRHRAAYSARLFLVSRNYLYIDDFPVGFSMERIPLNQVAYLECGCLLGKYWIGVATRGNSYQCAYSRANQTVVQEFLRAFRAQLMPAVSSLGLLGGISYEPSLEVKFAVAETDELDPDEHLLLRFFNPHVCKRYRWYGFWQRERWQPADYIGVTRRRIFWLTDRYQDERQVGGIIARSAAIGKLTDATVRATSKGGQLQISLGPGASWRIPITAEGTERAKSFAAVLRSVDICFCSNG